MRTTSKRMQVLTMLALILSISIWSCKTDSDISQKIIDQNIVENDHSSYQQTDQPKTEKKDVVIDFSLQKPSPDHKNIQLTSQGLELAAQKGAAIFQSPTIDLGFSEAAPFIAFSINWPLALGKDVQFEVRASPDGQAWGDWQLMEEDTHSDPEGNNAKREMTASQLVYLKDDTKYAQYRVKLGSGNAVVSGIELYFFNPGVTPPEMERKIQEINKANQSQADPCPQPGIVTRSQWGSICPANAQCSGSVVTQTTSHIIIHHSAGSNSSSDWAAVVRSIQQYHVYTQGWSDIGYNRLIAPSGTVYEGRPGGDQTRGAHFCGNNSNTMGICMIGDYTNVWLTTNAYNSMIQLLAYKCEKDGISPTGSAWHSPSGRTLYRIAGHRDGCSTACPGNSVAFFLSSYRQDVKDKTDACEGVCFQSETDPVALRTLQKMSKFITYDLKGNGRDLITSFVANQSEIEQILSSSDRRYSTAQAAFAQLKTENWPKMQEAFLYDSNTEINTTDLDNLDLLLVEMSKVASTKSLKEALLNLQKGLSSMACKDVKTALKAYDMVDFTSASKYTRRTGDCD